MGTQSPHHIGYHVAELCTYRLRFLKASAFVTRLVPGSLGEQTGMKTLEFKSSKQTVSAEANVQAVQVCGACDSCTVGNRSFVDLESVAFLSTLFFLFPKLLNIMLKFIFASHRTSQMTSFSVFVFKPFFLWAIR